MRVLVTGGTGVIGEGVLPALLRRGHRVRLLSRHADAEASGWPHGVEAHAGDVAEPEQVSGAAVGCDAVVHIAGIVREDADATYDRVNVGGTRHLVGEAERSGVRRFVFVSSLGADRGHSAYHRSKRRAEEIVRSFRGEWVIVRPGNVYGPKDEVISLLLRLVRALPVLPAVGFGDQAFQPLWYEDAGEALARVLEREDVVGRTLEISGDETTSTRDLIARLSRVTGRPAVLLPVPGLVAGAVARAAEAAGVPLPVGEAHLTMLGEENVVRGENALSSVLGLESTPLDAGLSRLAAVQPETPPSAGVGTLEQRRTWADLEGPPSLAARLREEFEARFPEMVPFDAGRDEPSLDEDTTLTVSVPVRGEAGVRVIEATRTRITAVTLAGHFLAGILRFSFRRRGRRTRFEVEVLARPATLVDRVLMATFGRWLQEATWRDTVAAVVEASGAEAPRGVRSSVRTVSEAEARRIESRVEALVARHKRRARRALTRRTTTAARRSGPP